MPVDNIASASEDYLPAAFGQRRGSSPAMPGQLDPEQQRRVSALRKRDAAVRAHEQAHLAAAGRYARGGAQIRYETGPDGKRYAASGEVGIDTSPVDGDPSATIRKAAVLRRAALAPMDPSPQDRAIAARATRMETQARLELSAQGASATSAGGSLLRPSWLGELTADPVGSTVDRSA